MKKPYSLDFTIDNTNDRMVAIRDLLNNWQGDRPPTHNELEQMATYILYGHDENGRNAMQRGEVVDLNKRFNSFRTKDDKAVSLDALLMTDENGITPISETALYPIEYKNPYMTKQRTVRRPQYDEWGAIVDEGDADVPGMVELWQAIDDLERDLNALEKRDSADTPTNGYQIYRIRHQLIDMRRQQYYLLDAYKPVIPPAQRNVGDGGASAQDGVNFDSDSAYWMPAEAAARKIADSYWPFDSDMSHYEHRVNGDGVEEVRWVVRHQQFDWEDPMHVRALVDKYGEVWQQNWDKPLSWGRTLIYDFDRYVTMARLSPVREYILTRRIDKAKPDLVAQELETKFGIQYTPNHIISIAVNEIPKAISKVAKAHRLLLETPKDEMRQCTCCKRWLPPHTLFFAINNAHPDRYSYTCKKCERQRRVEKGEIKNTDGRLKAKNC